MTTNEKKALRAASDKAVANKDARRITPEACIIILDKENDARWSEYCNGNSY